MTDHSLPHLDNPFSEVGDVDKPAHANQGCGQDCRGQVPVGHHCLQHGHAKKGLLFILSTVYLAHNIPGEKKKGLLDVGVKKGYKKASASNIINITEGKPRKVVTKALMNDIDGKHKHYRTRQKLLRKVLLKIHECTHLCTRGIYTREVWVRGRSI